MKRIIIADDETQLRTLMENAIKSYLNKLNIPNSIEEVKDGKELLKKIKEVRENYDLILSDEEMPYLRGSEVIQEIRELGYEIPAYLVSGENRDYLSKKVEEVEANGFLQKPFRVYDLTQIIEKHLTD
jgi:CheY-like chemotaxis protein